MSFVPEPDGASGTESQLDQATGRTSAMEKSGKRDVRPNQADFKGRTPFGVVARPTIPGGAVLVVMIRKLHELIAARHLDEAPTRVILIELIVACWRRQT
jgi:hypothetical protein